MYPELPDFGVPRDDVPGQLDLMEPPDTEPDLDWADPETDPDPDLWSDVRYPSAPRGHRYVLPGWGIKVALKHTDGRPVL